MGRASRRSRFGGKQPGWHQLGLPFLDRTERLHRLFRRGILAGTTLVIVGMLGSSSAARYHLTRSVGLVHRLASRTLWGGEPDRAMIEADWKLRREHGLNQTAASLAGFFERAPEEIRELFRVAGMDPQHALVRYGRGDEGFVLSPQIFEADENGRSYRLRPRTRSVWLRQITINGGPFMMFQVPDTPRHRAAARRAGAIVDEGSVQNTNSWGLRGAEPDLSAAYRGIVLGDSFMQAMFNGDGDTPSVHLETCLRETLKQPVSILNTGHIGYSPEQYYFTLCEYGPLFHPQFVVVSVCPNDFGTDQDVPRGDGNWYDEAEHWLEMILRWCHANQAICLLVPIPTHDQVESRRGEAFYPGQVCSIFQVNPARYCFPLDEFIDENLRLSTEELRRGRSPMPSRLYNGRIADNHLSPLGARLWARIVGRRLTHLLARRAMIFDNEKTASAPISDPPSAPEPR